MVKQSNKGRHLVSVSFYDLDREILRLSSDHLGLTKDGNPARSATNRAILRLFAQNHHLFMPEIVGLRALFQED